MANATGTVATAASHADPLTSVPIVRTTLPATARPRWAIALSRLVPPNDVMTSAPKLPKVAKTVICSLPMTLRQIANSVGMTMVARTARSAAGNDQVTRHHGAAGCGGDWPAALALSALADWTAL